MSGNALAVSPSQQFQGSDGLWSTFQVDVGTPPATLFLLPSTSGSQLWVVLPAGCPSTAPSDCAQLRGNLFDTNRSQSFEENGDQSLSLPIEPEAALNGNPDPAQNYGAGSIAGSDTVTLGSSGDDRTLPDQTIAAYQGANPFLGQLGLNIRNSTPVSTADKHYSLLGYLNATGSISSAYYGYTAGLANITAYGSLTLGGYDAVRGNVDDVLTSDLAPESNRDLQIVVAGIKIGDNAIGAPSEGNYFIDSLVPEIWLPQDICDVFQATFGLDYEDTYGIYYVNETQHSALQASAPNVTFSLQAPGDAQNRTDITLSYAFFDQTLRYPLANFTANTSPLHFFPIKVAANSTQYYLGRTFLQAAYLAVDYDRRVFNVSPAMFPADPIRNDIVTVVSDRTASHKSGGLSTGAIVGIVIGVIAALALIAGLVFWFSRRRKQQRRREREASFRPSSIGGTTLDDTFSFDPSRDEMSQIEHYKPGLAPGELSGEEQDQFKPELDATGTARRAHHERYERHELSGGSVRRISDQSSVYISPLEERRRGHMHSRSGSSGMGQPSPPLSGHPSPPLFGRSSPPPGHPASPPEGHYSINGLFELHGQSSQDGTQITPRAASPIREESSPIETTTPRAGSPEPPAEQGTPLMASVDSPRTGSPAGRSRFVEETS